MVLINIKFNQLLVNSLELFEELDKNLHLLFGAVHKGLPIDY